MAMHLLSRKHLRVASGLLCGLVATVALVLLGAERHGFIRKTPEPLRQHAQVQRAAAVDVSHGAVAQVLVAASMPALGVSSRRGRFALYIRQVLPFTFDVEREGLINELQKASNAIPHPLNSPLGQGEHILGGGVRLNAVGEDTLPALLGLAANDELLSLNGDTRFGATPEEALLLYRQLHDASETTLVGRRAGVTFTLFLRFR